MNGLLTKERLVFHKKLLNSILTTDEKDIPSNADRSNKLSIRLAQGMRNRMIAKVQNERTFECHEELVLDSQQKKKGQTSGVVFEELMMNFIEATFPKLQNLRPGKWHILHLGNQSKIKTSDFAQYEHLAYLNELVKANSQLAASLGNDYLVAPDVIIYRELYDDDELNQDDIVVDNKGALQADLRRSNGGKPLLHASLSAKWTMRSDRAQNSRTEALNLIRNRKGNLPHIVVVTGEPTPSRLASLALGTGDIDCMYHIALYELMDSIKEIGADDAQALLQTLIDGKRLKDISDLPLDLCD
ncbi:NgoMIV family type II restriction endonuclease [Acidaminococcus fermentans]|uniref:NgoMIV family type II restriction endonuclease n=1 Tax=Acidaminococcus fermentans TaxID=905 RepID=UPI00242DA917|nr:NgoMIV family type II restriction endonuclease [Acidaminococcus fermentans]